LTNFLKLYIISKLWKQNFTDEKKENIVKIKYFLTQKDIACENSSEKRSNRILDCKRNDQFKEFGAW